MSSIKPAIAYRTADGVREPKNRRVEMVLSQSRRQLCDRGPIARFLSSASAGQPLAPMPKRQTQIIALELDFHAALLRFAQSVASGGKGQSAIVPDHDGRGRHAVQKQLLLHSLHIPSLAAQSNRVT